MNTENQKINREEYEARMWEKLQEAASQKFGGRFIWHDHTVVFAKLMLQWFTKSPEFSEKSDMFGRAGSLDRGIALVGPTGVGKNWLFSAFHHLASFSDHSFGYYGSEEIEVKCSDEGFGWMKKLYEYRRNGRPSLLINDILVEKPAKYHGKELDAVPFLIDRLDDYPGKRHLHLTLNDDFDEMVFEGKKKLVLVGVMGRYHYRIHNRIKGLCNVFYMDGPDLREKE